MDESKRAEVLTLAGLSDALTAECEHAVRVYAELNETRLLLINMTNDIVNKALLPQPLQALVCEKCLKKVERVLNGQYLTEGMED